jgi:hypothetical protein
MLPVLSLAAVVALPGIASSQNGTTEQPSAEPAEGWRTAPGVTVEPPRRDPGEAERSRDPPGTGEGQPAAPGCPYRGNRLELIT